MKESRKIFLPVDVEPIDILGYNDRYLKIIERYLPVDIFVRGGEITITGVEEDVEKAFSIFKELLVIIDQGKRLNESAVEEVARVITFRKAKYSVTSYLFTEEKRLLQKQQARKGT